MLESLVLSVAPIAVLSVVVSLSLLAALVVLLVRGWVMVTEVRLTMGNVLTGDGITRHRQHKVQLESDRVSTQ